jgi:hypothetical protein
MSLPEPHLTKALIMLVAGDFEAGWKKYEWRWKTHDAKPWRRNFAQPVWNGLPLKDKTLFVYAEQGVGDEIMFASCIPDVINQTASCFIECDRRLVPLFSRSFPEAEILERTGADNTDNSVQGMLPFFDLVIAIGSLPLRFRADLSCFPHRRSYLTPDPKKVDEWKKRVQSLPDGLRVGISWKGGKDPRSRKMRSVVLEQWKDILLLKGITFIKPFCKTEHVDCPMYCGLNSLDRIKLIMDRRSRAGEVINFIYFDEKGKTNIMAQDFKVRNSEEMSNIPLSSGIEIVDVTPLKETFAKM